MLERGNAGAHTAPRASAVRSLRALPRRAFRVAFARRAGAEMAPPKRTFRVEALGRDSYRLVTTVTAERICTAADLIRLGIKPPEPEVPWTAPPGPMPIERKAAPESVHLSPYAAAMTYWREQGFPIDRRMSDLLPSWLDEFGLEGVLRAMHEVAMLPGHGAPYFRLVGAIRRLKKEAGSP